MGRVFYFCNNRWFWVFTKIKIKRITTGSGYLKKKPRIKELPGPGRYTEKNSESEISDKCPEPATSLVLIIPGIFRAFKKSLKELPGFMKEPENTWQFSRLTLGCFQKY